MQIEVNDQFDKSSAEAGVIENIAWFVAKAESMGLVVEVSRCPLQPLAMGNHVPVIDVRRARKAAE